MTIAEFGAQLKPLFPQYKDLPDQFLALRFLDEYPQYWDLITPVSTLITDLMKEELKPDFHIFRRQTQRAGDKAFIAQAHKAAADALGDMQAAIESIAQGIPPSVYPRIIELRESQQLQVALEHERAKIELWKRKCEIQQDLEAAQFVSLRLRHELDEIKQYLFALYEEKHTIQIGSDPATVREEKLALITTKIVILERYFYDRAKASLVSLDDAQGLLTSGEDPDGAGKHRPAADRNDQQVSNKRNRLGFRPADDSD